MSALVATLQAQPQLPRVDFGCPLAIGLKGLLWMGNGRPVDLVTLLYATQTNAALKAQSRGLAQTVTSAGGNGISYARLANSAWRISGALSCFSFFNHTTPGSSRALAGAGSGGASGYMLSDRFGARTREVNIVTSGGSGNVSAGTWSSVPTVRGLTWDGTTLTGYDDGISFGTATSSGTVTYDGTFSRVFFLGNADQNSAAGHGYWMAVWNRPLSKVETAYLAANPFCLFLLPRTSRFSTASATLYTATLTGSSTASASVQRDPTLFKAAAASALAAIAKAAASAKAATTSTTAQRVIRMASSKVASSAPSATVARAAAIVRQASAACNATLVRAAAVIRVATSTPTATVATLKARLLDLQASVTASAVLTRAPALIRSASSDITTSAARAIAAVRSASSSVAASAQRAIDASAKVATSTTTASAVALKARLLTLSASTTVVASIARSLTAGVTIFASLTADRLQRAGRAVGRIVQRATSRRPRQ